MGDLAQEQLIVVAPTAFKGTLSPRDAARAMARGVRRTLPRARIVVLPVADGGDGTREVLSAGGRTRTAKVSDPLGRSILAPFTLLDGDAILEMADASGLKLLREDERDPETTTTFGTGELILAALHAGAKRVLLGVGGSATVDGGEGAVRALGDPRLCRRITVLCDVSTKLLDAPRIFGPQKGATPAAVKRLERRLRALPRSVWNLEGSGAAGGLAGGLAAHGAKLVRGAEFILRRLRFRDALRGASLVLTGEGRFDATSLQGKAVGEVIRACGPIPCVVICGSAAIGGPPVFELQGRPLAEVAALACRYRSG